MKKILSLVLACLMLFTISMGVSAYTINKDDTQIGAGDIFGNTGVSGDVNGDGAMNTTDLAVLKLFLAGVGDDAINPDVDGNGLNNTSDLAALKLMLAGAN